MVKGVREDEGAEVKEQRGSDKEWRVKNEGELNALETILTQVKLKHDIP